MKDQTTIGTPNNRSRRRLPLSQADVRAIFSCTNNYGPLPDGINSRISLVPNVGSNKDSKLPPIRIRRYVILAKSYVNDNRQILLAVGNFSLAQLFFFELLQMECTIC
mmetsp:Transcript_27067/g.58224  ORF Transcript_27067/g.58224 Transcript_27067/m.58224 type:complete len:108 (+) Transcript_27067:140-463(+)